MHHKKKHSVFCNNLGTSYIVLKTIDAYCILGQVCAVEILKRCCVVYTYLYTCISTFDVCHAMHEELQLNNRIFHTICTSVLSGLIILLFFLLISINSKLLCTKYILYLQCYIKLFLHQYDCSHDLSLNPMVLNCI